MMPVDEGGGLNSGFPLLISYRDLDKSLPLSVPPFPVHKMWSSLSHRVAVSADEVSYAKCSEPCLACGMCSGAFLVLIQVSKTQHCPCLYRASSLTRDTGGNHSFKQRKSQLWHGLYTLSCYESLQEVCLTPSGKAPQSLDFNLKSNQERLPNMVERELQAEGPAGSKAFGGRRQVERPEADAGCHLGRGCAFLPP